MKRTLLDYVEREPSGFVRVGFLKQTLDEEGNVIEERKHLQGCPPDTDLAWMLEQVNGSIQASGKYAALPDCTPAHAVVAAAAEACDGKTAYGVSFGKGLLRIRRNGEGQKFGVRDRAKFDAACPAAGKLRDMVFTPEVIAADDTLLAKKAEQQAERARIAAEARERQVAQAKADLDASVERVLRANGVIK